MARIPTTQESINLLEKSNQGLQRRPLVTDPASLFGNPQSLTSKQQGGLGAAFRRQATAANPLKKTSTSVSPINSEYDAPYRGKKNERNAFLISTLEDIGTSGIEFWINPSECGWRVPLRTTIEAIQGGAVHHEWDSIGIGLQNPQKFDQPVINFTFQSGNIAPYSWADVQQRVDASQPLPAGLGNFYDFLNLLNKPNITTAGEPNYVIIQYKSLMMPNIMLMGFFTQEGVQWTDNAENPNGISTWGASFVVFSSYPSLYENGLLRDWYNDMFTGN